MTTATRRSSRRAQLDIPEDGRRERGRRNLSSFEGVARAKAPRAALTAAESAAVAAAPPSPSPPHRGRMVGRERAGGKLSGASAK